MSDSVVRFRDRILFGLGASGESATNWIFNTLAFFFYNQIIGLPGTLSAIAVGLGILFDAVTDPVVGAISDRTSSSLGRRHPWMLIAPVPIVLSMVVMFLPPEAATQGQLFIWLITTMLTLRIFSTLYSVPHLAFGAELSADYYGRTKIMSYNNLFYFVGTIFMHLVTWFIIFPAYQDGRYQQEAYLAIVAVYSAFAIVMLYSSALGTLRLATRSRVPALSGAGWREGISDLVRVVRNRNYKVLLIGLFFLSITIGTHETLSIYIASFYWGLSNEQIGWLILYSVIGYITGFGIVGPIQRLLDKRLTIVMSAACLSVFWSAAVSLSLLGISPDRGSWQLVFFIMLWGALASTSASVLNITVMSALADIAEEHQVQTGFRQEGVFYSARTFFAKVSNAIGHVVAGVALDVIQFPRAAKFGEIEEEKLRALALIDGPFAMFWGLCAALIYSGYNLSLGRIEELRRMSSMEGGQTKASDTQGIGSPKS